MNSNQTLEIEIRSTGEKSLKVINDLMKSITGIENVLTNIYLELGHIETKTGAVKSITKVTTNEVKKDINSVSTAIKGINFTSIVNGIKQLYNAIKTSSDRAEELNLFNVVFKNIEKNGHKAFSTLGLEATRFQYRLNEAFGTNMTDTLRYQALFQSMGENAGIQAKYANIMSENLTKMTYDLASLYNRSEKETAEALKSGIYAGQTKPMRKFGVDVTQGSLTPILGQLGITDRTVTQMSQAEKEILRYIGTLNQAKVAMKDFAQTIESPANQLKVLRNQFAELRVAIGNLFIGMFADIIPYANAVLMVLKEIAKAIAGFFNIQVRDFNSGIGALEDEEEAFEGIGNGASGAAKAAKELNRQVLKFDQINNIKSPTKSSSGGGTGGGAGLTGGIDKRLLDAIKGYDNLMDKVRMKATEIRDRWLQILGFSKVIDPITGEISFKYKGFATTVKNLWERFKNLNPQVKLLTTLLAGMGIVKVVTTVKKLITALGGTGLFKAISGLFTPLKTMFDYSKMYYNLIGKEGITGTERLTSAMSEGIKKWKDTASATEKAFSVLKGSAVVAGSVLVLKTGLDDMRESGINVVNSLETLGGVLGSTLGAAQIGSIFGPWGTAIGGAIGLIGSLVAAIDGIGNAADEEQQQLNEMYRTAKDNLQGVLDAQERLNDTYNNTDSSMRYYENLLKELDQYVDKNGKIKDGYEDRAKTITDVLGNAFGIEVKIVDGVIQKYEELHGKIDELIQQKRALAKFNALEEEYNTALEKQSSLETTRNESYAKYNDQIAKRSKYLEEQAEKYKLTTDEMQKIMDYETGLIPKTQEIADIYHKLGENCGDYTGALRNTKDEYEKLTEKINTANNAFKDNEKAYRENERIIATWEKAYGYYTAGAMDKLDYLFAHEQDIYGKSTQEVIKYWEDQIDKQKTNLEILEKNRYNYSEGEYQRLKKQYNDELALAQGEYDNLQLVLNTKMNGISDDIVKQWQDLGKQSVTDCVDKFSQLPVDLKTELYEKMKTTGEGMSKELQKGLEAIKAKKTVEIDGDDAKLRQKLQSITWSSPFKAIKEVLSITASYKALGGIFSARGWSNIPQYANGGSPTHGTLFAAGENGAEIVGNINRRTEVLNRSQIASAIYSAVASAMSNANIGGGEVHLYAHTDEGVIIDRINSKTKQTGRCPINIPA